MCKSERVLSAVD